jgi:squalene-hopene/tetraprenyl-beta-curcumene cyclase
MVPWLLKKEIRRKGDWSIKRPNVEPSGWYFEFANEFNPDIDDSAMVMLGLAHAPGSDAGAQQACHERAVKWTLSMQSKDGGWAAFDADNNWEFLSQVPFADHNAMLDPTCADITGRVLEALAANGVPNSHRAVRRGVEWLVKHQEADGSWYGRWGMNYIYGTWSVLCALNAAGLDHPAPEFRKAVAWLVRIQNSDGGWGEDGASYKLDYRGYEPAPSTASQTAWALLGLMAAGEIDHPAVARGIDYLSRMQGSDGFWDEPRYTATGFPRVFYLRYHGYRSYFPLWALARYRNLLRGNARRPATGM